MNNVRALSAKRDEMVKLVLSASADSLVVVLVDHARLDQTKIMWDGKGNARQLSWLAHKLRDAVKPISRQIMWLSHVLEWVGGQQMSQQDNDKQTQ